MFLIKFIVFVGGVLLVLLIFGLVSILLSVLSMKRSIWKGTQSKPHVDEKNSQSTATGKRKIIPQDEGEYVEFEEV